MATKTLTDVTVKFEDIIQDVENIRDLDKKYVKELAASIDARGLEEPLKVQARDGKYVLISGFHRYEAIDLLRKKSATSKKKWAEVKVTFFHGEDNPLDQRESNFVSNVLRKNLSPPEVSRAAFALSDEGSDLGKIAKDIGYSKGRLSAMVRNWTMAIDAVRHAALSGLIALDVLDTIVKQSKGDPEKQKDLLEKALKALKAAKNPRSHKARKKAKKAAGGTVKPGKRDIWAALEEIEGINRKYVDGFYYALLCCLGEEDLEEAVQAIQNGEDPKMESTFEEGEEE